MDYAVWQRERMREGGMEEEVGYWKEQLRGAGAALELPTDRPRPAVQTYSGRRRYILLPGSLSGGLKKLGRQEGTTLFMTLLAGFKALLYKYTRQEDIIVGTPIAGRNDVKLEKLIGLFINTLALRTDLSGNPTLREVLSRLRKVSLDAYDHKEIPFEKVVEEVQPERASSRQPLFQVMFVLQNAPRKTIEVEGISLSPFPIEKQTLLYDLSLQVMEEGEELRVILEYNSHLFDVATIDRMLSHYTKVLETMIADTEQRVINLQLMGEAEKREVVEEWNDTRVSYSTACLHELIEQQARLTPEATAVAFLDQRVSYGELNRRANQVARYLRELGAGPEVRVGICVERSAEMVVGLVGIMKAGGAYVPLEATYPKQRLDFMLADSGVQILLAASNTAHLFEDRVERLISLDSDWQSIAQESGDDLDSRVSPDNLAYVIYTSGSTGMPKGAMNTHRGICNRLHWMQDAYGLCESDRVLQKTPFSFDVSVWEFFWPLITGATLEMAVPGGHLDSAYLVKTIIEKRITTIHFVPSMLQVFLEEKGAELCASLKRVICSGEALPFHLQERFLDRMGAELHNLYGPTEAAVDVTFWKCARGSARASVPIGRPIANTQIYILDQAMQPVPMGVPGELHIGGTGVGRGYLDRPGLTSEKFIPDAFGDNSGARLYKTGDLAKLLPDGSIEFLGRLDHQVKIRGYRIELGEIEAALRQHSEIRDVVVMPHRYEYGDLRLVAYIVLRTWRALGVGQQVMSDASTLKDHHHEVISELQRYLKHSLPEYMVPSHFIVLETLPLSPNGKIDRNALPAPDHTTGKTRPRFVAPRTFVEEEMAKIWAEIISIEKVGIHDDFFELGGHSLLLTQLASRIRSVFKVEVPLRILFDNSTLVEMTRMLLLAQVQQSDRGRVLELIAQVKRLSPDEARALLNTGATYH